MYDVYVAGVCHYVSVCVLGWTITTPNSSQGSRVDFVNSPLFTSYTNAPPPKYYTDSYNAYLVVLAALSLKMFRHSQ